MADERKDSRRPEEVAEDMSGGTGEAAFVEPGDVTEAQNAAQEPGPQQAAEPPAPPPDIYGVLRFCLGLVIEQAWVHLGLHLAPGMTETQMDLPRAKVAIDAAASIYEHLKPDADPEERRAMEMALTNLRVNFTRKAGQS